MISHRYHRDALRQCGAALLAMACGLVLTACGTVHLGAGGQGSVPTNALQPVTAADCARQPVIFIPGLQGSTLIDGASRTRVWGHFIGRYAAPGTPEGQRLLALPMHPGTPLHALRDGVVADGLLYTLDFKLLRFVRAHVPEYRAFVEGLAAVGYRVAPPGTPGPRTLGPRTPGPAAAGPPPASFYNAFIFTYDWRRDLVESARALDRFVQTVQAYLTAQAARCAHPSGSATVDLVTHSMGGLVARYFLRYGAAALPADGALPPVTWAGAAQVRQATLIAPPNGGSLTALQVLLEGRSYLPGQGAYSPAVLGTYPSLYMLLPHDGTGQVVAATDTTQRLPTLFDPALWERLGWGLANPALEPALRRLLPQDHTPGTRRAVALDHLWKCLLRAARFNAALDAPAAPPDNLTITLIVGADEPMPARLAVDLATGRARVVAEGYGDGRVLRQSATRAFAAWSAPGVATPRPLVHFVPGRHMSIIRSPHLTQAIYPPFAEALPPFQQPPQRSTPWTLSLDLGLGLPVGDEPALHGPAQDAGWAVQASVMQPVSPRTGSRLSAGVSVGYLYYRRLDLEDLQPANSPRPATADHLEGGRAAYLQVRLPAQLRIGGGGALTAFLGASPGLVVLHQDEMEAATRWPDGTLATMLLPATRRSGFNLLGNVGLAYRLSPTVDLVTQAQINLLTVGGLLEAPVVPLRIGLAFRR